MSTAVYPGSFNPWHAGHEDILKKALATFDRVTVALGSNPNKGHISVETAVAFKAAMKGLAERLGPASKERFNYRLFAGLLTDLVEEEGFGAVIRGLRNGHDLQHEMNQQYWYEDLGLKVPVVYFICDRRLAHISSSAIRALKGYKGVRTKQPTEIT